MRNTRSAPGGGASKINDDDWNNAWEDEEEEQEQEDAKRGLTDSTEMNDLRSTSMTDSYFPAQKSKKLVSFTPEVTSSRKGKEKEGNTDRQGDNSGSSSSSSNTGDRQIIMESVEYDRFMEIKTSSITVRLIWLIQVFTMFVYYFFPASYRYIMIITVASLSGLYGSFKNDHRFIAAYLVYLVVCVLILLLTLFIAMIGNSLSSSAIVATMLIIAMQLFAAYKSYQYWEKLPRGRTFEQTYSKFVSGGGNTEMEV